MYEARVKPFSCALDATLWDEPVTGIGLYARQLYRGLTAQQVAVERWGAERSPEHPRSGLSRSLWSLGPLRSRLEQAKPSLYHAVANFNLPLTRAAGVPYVLTLHDLVPLLLPDTVSTAFRWQFRAWLSRSLLVADHVICVSEVTRRSLHEHFEVPHEKVTVIHHGVDHALRRNAIPGTHVIAIRHDGGTGDAAAHSDMIRGRFGQTEHVFLLPVSRQPHPDDVGRARARQHHQP